MRARNSYAGNSHFYKKVDKILLPLGMYEAPCGKCKKKRHINWMCQMLINVFCFVGWFVLSVGGNGGKNRSIEVRHSRSRWYLKLCS